LVTDIILGQAAQEYKNAQDFMIAEGGKIHVEEVCARDTT